MTEYEGMQWVFEELSHEFKLEKMESVFEGNVKAIPCVMADSAIPQG